MISIYFDISPQPKSRPRFASKGKRVYAYTDKKTRVFEKDIKAMAVEQYKGAPLLGPLKIEVTFFIKPPRTVKRSHPHVKPDIDNLLKSLMDPLNGIVYKDDAQVVTVVAHKRYREDAGIMLEIFPMA